jgi:TolB-like protein
MPLPSIMPTYLRFGPYEVNLRAGELLKLGKRIKLRKKSFEVLVSLLDHPGEVVTRDELYARLWPQDVFVDFGDNLNTAVSRLRLALGDAAEKPKFIETLRGRGYRLIAAVSHTNHRMTLNSTSSLAVLPFANIGHEPDQEYLCDGLAEELINTLSRLHGLQVVARTSSFAFKGKTEDVREIGRKLNVSAILEGGIQRSGDRLRITVQLINTADGNHFWSERFDRTAGDVFAMEDEIGQAVARKIRTQLIQDDETSLMKRQTGDLAAYEYYLRGRHTLAARMPDATLRAIQYFDRALERDPGYALAHSALAECYCQIGFMGYLAPRKVFPKALAAVRRALDLDPMLAEAHALVGWASWAYDWDWKRSESCFHRAEELAPSCGLARQYHAFLLTILGRFDEAIEEIDYASRLDPLSLVIQTVMGTVFFFARKYDLAMDRFRATINADPSVQIVRFHFGRLCYAVGDYQEAIAQLEKAPAAFPTARGMLGAAYAKIGLRDRALQIIQELEVLSQRRYVGSLPLAMVHRNLGNMDIALDLFEEAFNAREGFVPFLNVDPNVGDLRSKPRFKAMLERLRLPPAP